MSVTWDEPDVLDLECPTCETIQQCRVDAGWRNREECYVEVTCTTCLVSSMHSWLTPEPDNHKTGEEDHGTN